jgi:putative ABC transport system permease protein
MTIISLIFKEIRRRKINFMLGLASVILSVAILIGALSNLYIYDIKTSNIIAQKENETKLRMAALEDDYRKIMKNLGFNLLILPKDQRLGDLYADDFASEYMPEDFAKKLSESGLMSIRHLLPSLQQKIKWPEQKRTIILIGTRGEVPFIHRDPKEPILIAVPKDHAIIGHELASSLELSNGDIITLLGRKFKVEQINEERGSKDDITIWIDLDQAQVLLDKPDKVNAILALKCHCSDNEISQIRGDITRFLPDVQVIEHGSKVLTRAEARDRAAQEAQLAIIAEKENRFKLRKEQERFSSILIPLVLLGSGILISLLFFANVRDRKSEIGILTAVGVKSSKIMLLFLGKAILMGTLGAVIGFILGLLTAFIRNDIFAIHTDFIFETFFTALSLAVFLSFAASWIPAYRGAQEDPADVLRGE